MNVVYAGYRSWAINILKILLRRKHARWNITGLITTTSPEEKIPNIPTLILNDPKELSNKKLKKFNPDVILFYGWSWMLPKEIFDAYPCLILHIAPLPKYRGGSPLQHQIIAGEKKSAVTILQADAGIDTGNIYSQSFFPLDGTLDDIFDRVTKLGSTDTRKILHLLAKGKIKPYPQDEKRATTYKRRKPSDSEITPEDFKNKSAKELYNLIRSLADPYPNAYIRCKDGKKLFFTGVKIEK